MAAMQRHWDIFCRVIDNFGDIGICWRLARQLASEHGLSVRLWVDDPTSLKPLAPALDTTLLRQVIRGVEVVPWTDDFVVDRMADVVIEAFACELPAAYVSAMAAAMPKPRWINLEYLTAESWAEDCHGMASPHPTLPLVKHFFFPGFTPTSGGLLRENGLLAAREAEQARLPMDDRLEISLFCYDTAPVGALLDAMAASSLAIRCHVPPGKPLAAVSAHLGGSGPWRLGKLDVQPIPFLALDDYDRLLWRCAINFVRGEDSFLRAQWAGRAFVWQIYEQEEEAHLAKLEAFLERYTAGVDASVKEAVLAMFRAWNTGSGVAEAWPAFLACREQLAIATLQWAEKLATVPDLATALVNFCSPKV
ncbi:MAG: elongation factor P maturation arginine rhamnosyltransferase EarP [Bacteroidota bacterium]